MLRRDATGHSRTVSSAHSVRLSAMTLDEIEIRQQASGPFVSLLSVFGEILLMIFVMRRTNVLSNAALVSFAIASYSAFCLMLGCR